MELKEYALSQTATLIDGSDALAQVVSSTVDAIYTNANPNYLLNVMVHMIGMSIAGIDGINDDERYRIASDVGNTIAEVTAFHVHNLLELNMVERNQDGQLQHKEQDNG